MFNQLIGNDLVKNLTRYFQAAFLTCPCEQNMYMGGPVIFLNDTIFPAVSKICLVLALCFRDRSYNHVLDLQSKITHCRIIHKLVSLCWEET